MQFEDIALKKGTEISDKKWSEFGSENWVQNLVQTDWGKSTRRYQWKQLYKLFYGYVSTRNEVNAMRVVRVQLGWLIGLVQDPLWLLVSCGRLWLVGSCCVLIAGKSIAWPQGLGEHKKKAL